MSWLPNCIRQPSCLAIMAAILEKEQRYIFENYFVVFLNPENPIIDTRINVVDTIDVELCAKMYVAANGGQYGRHLENLAKYGIRKYSVVFLDSKNLDLDTKIIAVAILEVKINVKMCLAAISAAILEKDTITYSKTVLSYSWPRKPYHRHQNQCCRYNRCRVMC